MIPSIMMIVFDLDDTLYKEADYVASGCKAVAREAEKRGLLTFGQALEIITRSKTIAKGFDRLSVCCEKAISQAYDCLSTDKGTGRGFPVKEILSVYRSHKPDIKLPDETAETLQALIDKGYRLALITDGRSEGQRAKIESLGISRFMAPENIIVSSELNPGNESATDKISASSSTDKTPALPSTDKTSTSLFNKRPSASLSTEKPSASPIVDKTSPVPFETLMAKNSDESKFAYIGDNPAKDFLWPNRMGWQTIMLCDRDNTNIHPQDISVTDAHQPQIIINSLSELPQIL